MSGVDNFYSVGMYTDYAMLKKNLQIAQLELVESPNKYDFLFSTSAAAYRKNNSTFIKQKSTNNIALGFVLRTYRDQTNGSIKIYIDPCDSRNHTKIDHPDSFKETTKNFNIINYDHLIFEPETLNRISIDPPIRGGIAVVYIDPRFPESNKHNKFLGMLRPNVVMELKEDEANISQVGSEILAGLSISGDNSSYNSSDILTLPMFKEIFPRAGESKCSIYLPLFNQFLPKYDLITPRTIAVLFGNIAQETGNLKELLELPSPFNKNMDNPSEPTGTKYQGMLGNNRPGDGPKYIGRGLIQITGREVYTNVGKLMGDTSIVDNPDLVLQPKYAAETACAYWKLRKLSKLCEDWNIDEVTRRVNGKKKLGLENRIRQSTRILQILLKNKNPSSA